MRNISTGVVVNMKRKDCLARRFKMGLNGIVFEEICFKPTKARDPMRSIVSAVQWVSGDLLSSVTITKDFLHRTECFVSVFKEFQKSHYK